MSAAIADRALRALAASPRSFRSVKAALLWYHRQLQSRLRVNRDLADVGTPRNVETAEIAVATFAAIANCLKPVHETDGRKYIEPNSALPFGEWRLRDEDEISELRARITGERQMWLLAWYEGDDSDGWGNDGFIATKWEERERQLAVEAGRDGEAVRVTEETVRKRCLQTERVLRERMENAGLLED